MRSLLVDACRAGDEALALALLEAKAEVNQAKKDGDSSLVRPAKALDAKMAKASPHPPRHAHSTHPRSPVSQEMLAGSALSPSFSPALSPLATRSPSISPMVGPLSSGAPLVVGGGPTRGVTRGVQQARYGGGPASSIPSGYSDPADKELRI